MKNARLVILYGSQTGTAEDLAVRISYEAQRLLYDCQVSSMDEFGAGSLAQESRVLFIASTTGQGDSPDNMTVFWRHLRRRALPSDWLCSLHFGVIGLGDSSYAEFNFVAKRLHRRLLQLGAVSLLADPALGDDQHDLGPDAAVDPWMTLFWQRLRSLSPLAPGVTPKEASSLPAPRHIVDVLAEEGDEQEPTLFLSEDQFTARLESNRRVTAETHFQDVRLLSFSMATAAADAGSRYRPGDVLAVMPQNLSEDVDEFLSLIGVSADTRLLIKSGPLCDRVRERCSLRWLAQSVLDLHSVPRRSFFQLLAHFADSQLVRNKMAELGSAGGQQDLFDYCNRPRRTLLEVLADFPDTARRVPLLYLLEMIPAIRQRCFSIASAPLTRPGCLQLLVAVVSYRSKLARPRVGLCSTWLSRLRPGAEILARIKPGTIQFPTQSVPVIMVGPGTGVAPFRSYIQHRTLAATGCQSSEAQQRPLVLFFGCRNRDGDCFFADEWERLQESGKLLLFTAYSRDQPEKCYVQHRIEEQSPLLWHLIQNEGAAIYIAGSSRNMPDDVLAALKRVARIEGEFSQSEADEWIVAMRRERRLQLETWS